MDVSSDGDSASNASVLEAAGMAILHANMSHEDQFFYAQDLGDDSTNVDMDDGRLYNTRQMAGSTRYNHNSLIKAGDKKRKDPESDEGNFEKAMRFFQYA